MYKENIFILNGGVVSSDSMSFAHSPVYEVIRIHNASPVFLEEHMQRLKRSAKLADLPEDVDYKGIVSSIKTIIQAANIKDNNIRIEVGIVSDGTTGYKVYPIPSLYPSEVVYRQGVDVETMVYERENPTVKIIRDHYTAFMMSKTMKRGVYELVLVSMSGKVLEGSKSNIFFVKGNEILTSMERDVLSGITRAKVFEIASKMDGVYIGERDISFKELGDFDAAFLTGTSPGILPIRRIDDHKYHSANNKLVKQLRSMYERMM